MKHTKIIALLCAAATLLSLLSVLFMTGCEKKKSVVIWTSGEEYKNAFYLAELQKKFPDYEFTMEYMNTSTISNKVLNEGKNCSCDIVLSEEYGYLEKCSDNLAVLSDFDYSAFMDELVPASRKYTPELKNGGCIIVNTEVLAKKGLTAPTSYQDLLDPAFKGLISMPSPQSSGTGYMFLRQLVNEWGEDEAFAYFEALTENMLHYTSSGSGPVNDLKTGEVAVGLGMTSQAVEEQKNGAPLEIIFFEEGSPYSMYGNAIVAGSADKAHVREVFDYLANDLCRADNEKYFPDQIFKNFTPEVEGFPKNVNYGDMSNDTLAEKERLQKKWTFG